MGEIEDGVLLGERETIYGVELHINQFALMAETEVGDPNPVLRGTCSCQLGILLFTYNPIQISYLLCHGPVKGRSLLGFYRFTGLFNIGHGKNFFFLHLSRRELFLHNDPQPQIVI